MMGTIPMAMIKENVDVDVRDIICIGGGYQKYGRWGRDHD
jgi:hypothetical protein